MLDFLMGKVGYLIWLCLWMDLAVVGILGFAKANGWTFRMFFNKPAVFDQVEPKKEQPRINGIFSGGAADNGFACPQCKMKFWPIALKMGIHPGYFNCKCKVDNQWVMSGQIYNGKVVAAHAYHIR